MQVECHRWAIEDGFETTKNDLGLDQNETRSWHGWHRYVSLVMLAFAMMAIIRHHATKLRPQKIAQGATPLIRWSVQKVRRIAVRLTQRHIAQAHTIARSLWRRAH